MPKKVSRAVHKKKTQKNFSVTKELTFTIHFHLPFFWIKACAPIQTPSAVTTCGVNMLDHLCLLNDEEGFLGSKTNSWTLLVCFHSLLRLRGRRLKGEGKAIPGAQEPRILQLPWQLYHNYPRPTSSAPPQTIPVSHRGERETRVTSDEAQGTMARRCERRSRFLLPAFLCPHQPLRRILSLPPPPLPCPFLSLKTWGGA